MATPRRARFEAVGEHAVATPIELFFDLVFVFALTRVTDWMAEDPTVGRVVRGILIITVMWWCWIGYAWLSNVVKADEGSMRIGLFAAMGAMFIGAITIPEAFDDLPGGLHGPMVFAFCYFAVRAVHIALFWVASGDDPQLRGQVLRFLPSMLGGTVLLLVASQTTGTTQTLLWLAALVVDYLGTFLSGSKWRLNSAGHFAERHGLIIIVALGESIVSIGIGVAALPISWPIIVATVLGLTIVWALWWAYFDVTALIAERALAAAEGARRVQLGRGAYTFLHLPMVVGIIMMALGLKKALEYTGDAEHHTLADPLYGVPLAALYGGAALYLLAHVWFRRYLAGQLNVERLVLGVLLVAVAPLAALLPAMASLALLAVLLVALIAWETHRLADERHRIRHAEGH
jgi:low temperature requirement protein LtrA